MLVEAVVLSSPEKVYVLYERPDESGTVGVAALCFLVMDSNWIYNESMQN